MDENEKIVPTEMEEVQDTPAKEVVPADETPEEENPLGGIPFINPDEPITKETIDNVGKLIKTVGENVQIMQSIWQDTQREFGLKDDQLKELYAFNNQHALPAPDDLPEDEEWDIYNGFDQLTDEDLEKIFGHEHPIYGVDTSQTIDRIKSSFKEFIEWMGALREYKNVQNGYAMLMDMYDEQNINELQKVCDNETDPEKKKLQQEKIDQYRSNKNIGFLKEPMDEVSMRRMLTAFTDKNKCQYLMKRSVDKLKQLKISGSFLPEIWGFEKRFLDEKYHRLNNLTLIYFMQLIVYCKCTDDSKDNIRRTHVVFMFSALDGYVQNRIDPARKDVIKENICAMLDQFLDQIEEGAETINDGND